MIRLMAAGVVLAWVAAAEPVSAATAESPTDWREDYAYNMGVAAMHYLFERRFSDNGA